MIIILTSVVPPELPMELSLAVTSSLSDLIRRCGVYCTEPWRIPLAGTVDTCCFDKTGTLTSDEMVLRGVRMAPAPAPSTAIGAGDIVGTEIFCADGTESGGNNDLLMPRAGAADGGGGEGDDGDVVDDISPEVLRVMAACHGLSSGTIGARGGRVMGDPLERAVLTACGWTLLGGRGDVVAPLPSTTRATTATPTAGGNVAVAVGPPRPSPIRILRRFAFTSRLKRMTVLASDIDATGTVWALTKGAPETVREFLRPGTVPPNYDAVYRRHMGMGQRVLALAYRRMEGPWPSPPASSGGGGKKSGGGGWSRPEAERDLTFGGFLVLDCPLKADSRRVIGELRSSGHECVMITGDAVLTAAEVARSVGIIGAAGAVAAADGTKRRKKKKDGAEEGEGKGKEKEATKTAEVVYELREVTRGFGAAASSSFLSSSSSFHVDFDAEQERQGLGGERSGLTVPSRHFAFEPLTSDGGPSPGAEGEAGRSIAYVPTNLAVVEDMLRRGEIAGVCVGGKALTGVAAEAVRRARSGDGRASGSRDGKDDAPPPPEPDDNSVLLHPAARSELRDLVPLVSVFARHAPRQKEAVLAALNSAGRRTLMCGDGTNDVGALKMAHVGISIVSVPDLESKQREAMDGVERVQEEERRERKRARRVKKKSKGGGASGGTGSETKKSRSDRGARKRSLEKHLRALAEAEEELEFVALGDASVASPFTSRAMSVKCVSDVLQRGRCTLVTMLQIYKILGVNSLVNALVLTRLHMAGAKQGDRQLMVVGMVVAGMFLFVTKGKPLSTLSPRRPPASVLCAQTLLSIAAQFLVHFFAITLATALATCHMDPWDPSLVPDGAFNANVLNTSTFLMVVLATINTFAINYQGRPFMEDLGENVILLRSLQICYVALFACAAEVFPPLNDLLQLSTLPSAFEGGCLNSGDEASIVFRAALTDTVGMLGFKMTLCGLMALDSIVVYAVERAIASFFNFY